MELTDWNPQGRSPCAGELGVRGAQAKTDLLNAWSTALPQAM